MHEVDDLVYYADGNKRTLTDAQIAMFRHSEIYSILRERQVRKENRDADGETEANQNLNELDADLRAEQQNPILPEIETEAACIGNMQGKGHEDSILDRQTGSKPPVAKKKRKRNDIDTGDKAGNAYTYRRLARELDSTKIENISLDYGEESAGMPTTTHAQSDEPKGHLSAKSMDRDRSGLGQKIWWPVLQPT